MQRPEAIYHSDLEITLPTDLEQIIPPGLSFEDKFYHSGPHVGQRYNSEQSRPSTKADQRRWWNSPAFGLPALIVAICLAVGLGGGLGGWLAAHRKSSPANCTTGSMNNSLTRLPAYTTLPGETSLLTLPTPTASTKPTTGSASDSLSTLPTSATSKQTTFVACPSPNADGAVYIATNRPLPLVPDWQISNTSLSFSVNCNTNWVPNSGDSVLQTQSNMNSLQECIDACATYTWLANSQKPGIECSGVAWENGRVGNSPNRSCFLKANLTQPCNNITWNVPGYDGAVLLYE